MFSLFFPFFPFIRTKHRPDTLLRISGKSTLTLSLLRLNELVSGQILIDGQDISLMTRPSIRQRISCLSQEPFIFPGTVRENADPQGKVSNTQIVDALQSVGVWTILAASHSSTDEEVLDSRLDENILSQGQKQLFCLARALLKRSKILILDEPTSRYVHELFRPISHSIHCLRADEGTM
jgi:ABC-type multidrug transport system fused ATPase/permease subunit